MAKIIIQLDLTQMEAIRDYFFPFMESLCKTNLLNSEANESFNLSECIVESVFQDVQDNFFLSWDTAKLQAMIHKKKFHWQLTEAEAITVYKLSKSIAFGSEQFWLINLQSHIQTVIENQVWEIG